MPTSPLDPTLQRRLEARWGEPIREAHPLAGDVSSRRYLRIERSGGGSVILVLYPEPLRDACRRFRTTSRLLTSVGVRVPEVLAEGCEEGWMVVEDLGPETLYERFAGRDDPWSELAGYFRRAVTVIRSLQELPRSVVAPLSPPLDATLLRYELALTRDAILAPRGLLDEDGWESLETLCEKLGEGEPVPCHRDLMVRNLVPLADGPVGVLDHQDLRLGPRFYDLASLLNDSLFPPREVEEGLLAPWVVTEGDQLAYHRTAAQRTLKAVGTYARTAGTHHRQLIGPTLARALTHLAAVPETAALAARLTRNARREDLLD